MMNTVKLIEYLRLSGHELIVKDRNISITNASSLTANVINLLKMHKDKIIDILNRDTEARELGMEIKIPGVAYSIKGNDMDVDIELVNGKWIALVTAHQNGESMTINDNIIATSSSFEELLATLLVQIE